MNDGALFESFPHYVDARKVFSQKGKFAGNLSNEKFDRLRALLVEGHFSVYAELHFSIGERGRRMIEGSVSPKVQGFLRNANQRRVSRPLSRGRNA